MPDTTQFNAPDKPSHINPWYIGGGIVGIGLLFFLLSKNSSGGSTIAGATSINAALGSLQEQALNIQGGQSKVQTSIDTGFSGITNTVNTDVGGVNDTITSGFAGVNTGIAGINTGITGINSTLGGINSTLGSILGEEKQTQSNLEQLRSDMEKAFGANSAQVAAITQQIGALGQQMQAGFSGLNSKADQLTQMVQAAASNAVQRMDFSPFAGNIIFSRADNTRYLAGAGGLTELTYQQEMSMRNAGAQIMYIDPSLSQYKIGGRGDRG